MIFAKHGASPSRRLPFSSKDLSEAKRGVLVERTTSYVRGPSSESKALGVEPTGIEPVTSTLPAWRSPG